MNSWKDRLECGLGRAVWHASLAVVLLSSLSATAEPANPSEETSLEPIAPIRAPFPMPQLQRPVFPDRMFDIRDFGAVGDGKTKSTKPIAKAVAACAEAGGGRVVIPPGTWLTGAIHLKSNIDLHLAKGAVLRFSTDPERLPAGRLHPLGRIRVLQLFPADLRAGLREHRRYRPRGDRRPGQGLVAVGERANWPPRTRCTRNRSWRACRRKNVSYGTPEGRNAAAAHQPDPLQECPYLDRRRDDGEHPPGGDPHQHALQGGGSPRTEASRRRFAISAFATLPASRPARRRTSSDWLNGRSRTSRSKTCRCGRIRESSAST